MTQIGIILEDKESGLRLMVVKESEHTLNAADVEYKGRKLTLCPIQPSGIPTDDIRVGMDPGSRSKPGTTPEI